MQQLCWTCRKCYGGCAWSDGFAPVAGWTAEPTRKSYGQDGYAVTDCPEYMPEDASPPTPRPMFETREQAARALALGLADYKKRKGLSRVEPQTSREQSTSSLY